jgi:hypothetical protein
MKILVLIFLVVVSYSKNICRLHSKTTNVCSYNECYRNICGIPLKSIGIVPVYNKQIKTRNFMSMLYTLDKSYNILNYNSSMCDNCCAFNFIICLRKVKTNSILKSFSNMFEISRIPSQKITEFLNMCSAVKELSIKDSIIIELSNELKMVQLTFVKNNCIDKRLCECIKSMHLTEEQYKLIVKQIFNLF